jgi:hypothetical protein
MSNDELPARQQTALLFLEPLDKITSQYKLLSSGSYLIEDQFHVRRYQNTQEVEEETSV